MIRILIVHQVAFVGELKAAALGGEPDMKIVGCVQQTEAALELLKQKPCDVVLASIDLANSGALKVTRSLVQSDQRTRMIVTGLNNARPEILRCIEEGAAGYVLREESLADMVKKIRAVYRDEFMVSPGIAAALIARVAELKQMSRMVNGLSMSELEAQSEEMTPREWEVLRLIERGYTNQAIGEELTIEIGTVKNHVHNLFCKLGVQNRRQAAMVARQLLADELVASESHNELHNHVRRAEEPMVPRFATIGGLNATQSTVRPLIPA
jgi:DNA-binding NarL/FixJ family response regulator